MAFCSVMEQGMSSDSPSAKYFLISIQEQRNYMKIWDISVLENYLIFIKKRLIAT